jgi:hypothetical protein
VVRRRVGMIWSVALAAVALALPSSAAAYQDSWVTLSDISLNPAYRGISPNLTQSGGKVYVLGGATKQIESQDIEYYTATDVVSVYDPATDTWRDVDTKVPYAVEVAATVTTADGRMWLIGGLHRTREEATPSRRVQIYNPATNSWSTAAPLPAGGEYASGGRAVTNSTGRIWDFDTDSGRVWMYRPSTNSWTARSSIPSDQRDAGVAWATNTSILIIGGYGSPRMARIYNTITNTWHKVAPLPHYAVWTMARRGTDGRVYSFQTDYDAPGTTQIYNPITNTWRIGAPDSDGSGARPVVRVPGGFISVGGQTGELFDAGTDIYH